MVVEIRAVAFSGDGKSERNWYIFCRKDWLMGLYMGGKGNILK